MRSVSNRVVLRGERPLRIQQPAHPVAPKCCVKWLHCTMIVLVTGLCLAFSDADVEFDFVLMIIFIHHKW